VSRAQWTPRPRRRTLAGVTGPLSLPEREQRRAPSSGASLETIPSPSAVITRRVASDAASVVLAVAGEVGAHDATVLDRSVRAELAAGDSGEPRIVVVILTEITSFTPALPDVLVALRDRARELGRGLHLLDFGRSGLQRTLQEKRS
jgi:hypothetical protein